MITTNERYEGTDVGDMTDVDRVVVTGVGICSAIGNNIAEVVRHLRDGKSNARTITRFEVDPFQTKMAAEVELEKDMLPPADERAKWDRGTLMAVIASQQALKQARLSRSSTTDIRIGVATGVSGSGQFQTARVGLDHDLVINAETANIILDKNIPNYQAEQIAGRFGLTGPQTTVASASAGSGIAISIALRWLQSNRCDAVLAGGSECLSVLNIIGFDVLGITSEGKCQPFSASAGMMMGEGAGYLLFEREQSARQRHAHILGFIDGVAVSADAFDPVLFDPTGSGQRRAMCRALEDGDVTAIDVDWLRASGSGGRDQDSAELIAIKEVFAPKVPPVTSLEPFFGHCNGAGPAIGLVAAISSMNEDLLPPTLNFEVDTNAPSEIDFVPNQSRPANVERTLCNSAAFGGTNVAILCSRKGSRVREKRFEDVVITGVGTLSALGIGGRESLGGFGESETGIAPHDRFELPDFVAPVSGLVRDLKVRKTLPQISMRGVDLLGQYAAVASHLALKDANLDRARCEADRLGIVSGIAYASGKTMQRLMSEVYRDYVRPTVGKVMLRNGRFMVASQLAYWFSLQGYNSTVTCGELSGLHALSTAADQLRNDDGLDALLVVGADEVSYMHARLHSQRRHLMGKTGRMSPHDPASTGRILGEGAVAMILEKQSFAERRGAPTMARITGQAIGFHPDADAKSLRSVLRIALSDAGQESINVDFVAGLGTGVWSQDAVEYETMQTEFGETMRLTSLSGHTGFMDSCSGLFSACAAISALHDDHHAKTLRVDELGHPISDTAGDKTNRVRRRADCSLVMGSGRAGHQLAMLFGR